MIPDARVGRLFEAVRVDVKVVISALNLPSECSRV